LKAKPPSDHAKIERKTFDTIHDYFLAILSAISFRTQQRNAHLRNPCKDLTTLFIDTKGVGTFDFDLSTEDKNKLIQSGWDTVFKFKNQDPPPTFPILLEELPKDITAPPNSSSFLRRLLCCSFK